MEFLQAIEKELKGFNKMQLIKTLEITSLVEKFNIEVKKANFANETRDEIYSLMRNSKMMTMKFRDEFLKKGISYLNKKELLNQVDQAKEMMHFKMGTDGKKGGENRQPVNAPGVKRLQTSMQ